MNIIATTFALREKSIRLCEKKSLRLAREEQLSRDIFFSPSRKDLDDLTHPLITLANPLPTPCEAFAPSAALREKSNFREIFFSPSRKGRKGEA